MAELTEAQLKALIAIFTTQTEDFIQAVINYKLGINEATVSIPIGTTPIVFTTPYDANEGWDFRKINATAADGFNVGLKVTNKTHLGFSVTVTKACDLYYMAAFNRNWISD